MEMLVQTIVGNAVAAAVLALVAWAVGKTCKSPVLRNVLWIIVLGKLIVPPAVRVDVPLDGRGGGAHAVAPRVLPMPPQLTSNSSPDEPFATSRPSKSQTPLSDSAPRRSAAGTEPRSEEPAVATREDAARSGLAESHTVGFATLARQLSTWTEALGCFWAAGAVVYLAVALLRTRRFLRAVSQAAPADECVRAEAAGLAARMGLRRVPSIELVPSALPPLLWAPGRSSRIFFPQALWEGLEPDERSALLAHELAHARRGDRWIRWLELVAGTLHWWNPIAWWARRELRAAEEECCDAWVVWALPKAADAYGKAILKTIDFLTGKRGVLPAAATGMAGGRRLKHRIVQVVQGRSTRSLPLWGWPCVGLLASALLLAPAPADEKPAAKAPSGGPPPASVDSAPLRGGRVDVAKGVVSVAEFLQFVVTATGLPVIPDGLERTVLGGQVHIVRPFESASLDLILFVLAASGVALEPTRLPDGSGALLARPPKKTLELTPAPDPLRGRLGAESTVSISSGHVFVLEALAFASEMTGLPVVLVPGGDWARTRTIFAPAAVQKASVEVLAAFLRDAGVDLVQVSLGDGTRILAARDLRAAPLAAAAGILPRAPSGAPSTLSLGAGEVFVEELVRFLSEACDVSCRLAPGGPPLIHVPVAMPEAKPEDVVSILVASGHSMQLRKLPDGTAAFDIAPPQTVARTSAAAVELRDLVGRMDRVLDELKKLRVGSGHEAGGTSTLTDLLLVLRQGNEFEKGNALEAFLWSGVEFGARGAPPTVLELTASEDDRVSALALEAVVRWGLPDGGLAVMIRGLKASETVSRAHAAAALGFVAEVVFGGQGGGRFPDRAQVVSAVAPLTACLRDADARVRRAASRSLARFGTDAREALEPLASLLDDAEARVALEAALTAAAIAGRATERPLAENVVTILTAAVREGDDLEDQLRACEALGRLGPLAAAAIPTLKAVKSSQQLENAARRAAEEIERP